MAQNHFKPRRAADSPTATASPARTSASTKSCMMMRPRLAPSASLTSISLSRVAARANISKATLAQARTSSITRNALANPSPSHKSASRSKTDLAYGMTRGCKYSCVSGKLAVARAPMVVSCAWAWPSDTPGARRPNTRIAGPWPRSWSRTLRRRGTQKLCDTGKAKPSGITPATVCCVFPSPTVRPTTSGSPPKRACHTSYPMTTTGGAPTASSASTRARPRSGGTRATRNADALIWATSTTSPLPSVMRLRAIGRNAPRSSTDSSSSRQVTKSCKALGSARLAAVCQFWMPTMRWPSSSGSVGSAIWVRTSKPPTPAQNPNAIARPPTTVSPGYLTSIRSPSLKSSDMP